MSFAIARSTMETMLFLIASSVVGPPLPPKSLVPAENVHNRRFQCDDILSKPDEHLGGRLPANPPVDVVFTEELRMRGLPELGDRVAHEHHARAWSRGARRRFLHGIGTAVPSHNAGALPPRGAGYWRYSGQAFRTRGPALGSSRRSSHLITGLRVGTGATAGHGCSTIPTGRIR